MAGYRQKDGQVGANGYVFGKTARQGKTKFVVLPAQVGLSPLTPEAGAAEVETFDRDVLTDGRPSHTCACFHNRATSLVTWNNGVFDRGFWACAVQDFQITHAYACGRDSDKHLPWLWNRPGCFAKSSLVGALMKTAGIMGQLLCRRRA